MKEKWDKAIDEINEKYINEAAKTYAKHAAKQQAKEQYEYEASRPLELKPTDAPKKSKKAKIIGISAAAAAVVAVGVGAGVMLNRNNTDVLLPNDTPTAEATAEIDDPAVKENGVMTGSYAFEEGVITLQPPQQIPQLGGPLAAATPIPEDIEEFLAYIVGFSDYKAVSVHRNLLSNGYTLNTERSHYNALYADELDTIGNQVSLCYEKGEAEIIVSYCEKGSNFSFVWLPEGYFSGYLAPSETSSGAIEVDPDTNSYVCCGGVMIDGVPYYAANLGWQYGDENGSFSDFFVSAKGCSFNDITDILAGATMGSDSLTPVTISPFNADDYAEIKIASDNAVFTLSDKMIDGLSEILAEGSDTAIYNHNNRYTIKTYPKLWLYKEKGGMETTLQLAENDGEYFYIIDGMACFELTSEAYMEAKSWFADHAPTSFIGTILEEDSLGNKSDPASGRYYVESKSGAVYAINIDVNIPAGETVRVSYYGGVRETFPAQIDVYAMERAYDIAADTTKLIPAEAADAGFDVNIFNNHFAGNWTNRKIGMNDLPLTFSSEYDAFIDPVCFEMSDGYYLGYASADVDSYVYFIPKGYEDAMYGYSVYDHRNYDGDSNTRERTANSYYRLPQDKVEFSAPCYINGFGEEMLFSLLNWNVQVNLDSAEKAYNEITTAYVDGSGNRCVTYVDRIICDFPYIQELGADYAKIRVKYYTENSIDNFKNTLDVEALVDCYVLHTIEYGDLDRYVVSESVPCDENGTPLDGEIPTVNPVNPDAVTIHSFDSISADENLSACFEYVPVNENGYTVPTEARIYVKNRSDYIEAQLDVGEADAGFSMPKGARPVLVSLPFEEAPAVALLIPTEQDGKRVYSARIFCYKDGGLKMFDQFAFLFASTDISFDSAENIITVQHSDGTALTMKLDFDTFDMPLYKDYTQDSTATIKFADIESGMNAMGIVAQNMMGLWGSEDGMLEISFNDSPFSHASPFVGAYDGVDGYAMFSETDAWYILKNDRYTMYYFEDVFDLANFTDSVTLDTSEATAVYRNVYFSMNRGYYTNDGELGYLGLLDISYNKPLGDVPIGDFFDMEITDENGTKWVRTEDRTVDWGGAYSVTINGKGATVLKMQNSNNPSEFRHFSFILSAENGRLSWTDEHYSFDMSVCGVDTMPTDYAESVKAREEEKPYGSLFVCDTYFYTCDNGGYYAYRLMGGNQAQWLSDSEIFYNDGNGYKLVSDELGSVHAAVIGDRFCAVHDDEEQNLLLNIYSGDVFEFSELIAEDHIVNMGTSVQTHGNYLLVEFYGEESVVYAIVDVALEKPEIRYADGGTFTLNNDGTITFN